MFLYVVSCPGSKIMAMLNSATLPITSAHMPCREMAFKIVQSRWEFRDIYYLPSFLSYWHFLPILPGILYEREFNIAKRDWLEKLRLCVLEEDILSSLLNLAYLWFCVSAKSTAIIFLEAKCQISLLLIPKWISIPTQYIIKWKWA